MRRIGSLRSLTVTVAAASLVVMLWAVPAGAPVIGRRVPTNCSKASSTTSTATTTSTKSSLSGCSDAAITGGKGTLVIKFKNQKKVSYAITWNKTGTSTLVVTSKLGPSVNKCRGTGAKKDLLVLTTGTVTGGKGKAGTQLKNTKFSESLCAHGVGTATTSYLLPGSKVVV